jgi:hypothetical protein
MWKRSLRLALVLLLACLSTFVVLLQPPPSPVSREAFEKIE